MAAPVVFISYSHKDEVWKDKLLPQLGALEQAGVTMQVWEDRQIDAGATWYPEIQKAMRDAVVAILLISADYLASGFCIKEEVPFLLQRQEQDGMLLIPVLVRACAWKTHRWLADRQMLPRDGKCVAINFPGDQADSVFSEVAEQVFGHFKKLTEQPETAGALTKAVQKHIQAIAPTATTLDEPLYEVRPWPMLEPGHVDLTHLPDTGSALFGRDEDLRFLDQAWSPDEQSVIRVVAFIAQGGVGKSTLVNHWLSEMKREQFRGATRVFGWSFYSQGAREQGGASADTFIAAALRFFGDPDPVAGSPWDKGDRLARLVGVERSLLILDGLEPLQSPQTFERGKIRNPAIERMLRGLARQSSGLCLITTREPLTDLAGRPAYAARDLDQITPQAGRALLRIARVIGTDQELEELAGRFGPHALAVSLLGVYLYEQPDHGIGPAQTLAQLPGKSPVERVLAGFEQWLEDSPEREILRLLGFFDRPADEGCLHALRRNPVIKGLTDRLAKVKKGNWDHALARLAKLRLINLSHSGSGIRLVDAHPLLREYFTKQLREQLPEAWSTGHERLYKHLCETTKEGEQPTLEDLQSLYQAISHGCQAKLHTDVLHALYFSRIERGTEYYSTMRLGAMSSVLGAITSFFNSPWSQISPLLEEQDQALVLKEAGFALRNLGQLDEALPLMQRSAILHVKSKNWRLASSVVAHLNALLVIQGELNDALIRGEECVAYAMQSHDAYEQIQALARLGDTLKDIGRGLDAHAIFLKAEALQAHTYPNRPMLYRFPGSNFCDLLLDPCEAVCWKKCLAFSLRKNLGDLHRDVWDPIAFRFENHQPLEETLSVIERRASCARAWSEGGQLIDRALPRLTLFKVAFCRHILKSSDYLSQVDGGIYFCETNSQIKTLLDQASVFFRNAQYQNMVVKMLLSRAWFYAFTNRYRATQNVQSDLNEAWEVAERGPMKVYMADIHLYRARLFFREDKYPWESPEADLMAAEKLINDCGYHRRDEELADAKRAILSR